MDYQHQQQSQTHPDAHITPQFAPPPPDSGAGQSQPVPVNEIRVPTATAPNPVQPLPPTAPASDYAQHHGQAPPLPQRPIHTETVVPSLAPYNPSTYVAPQPTSAYPAPPQRQRLSFNDEDDPSNPIHYTRDPHKLIAYLVPFPKPHVSSSTTPADAIPTRFFIYTPPPPPLSKPAEGVNEGKLHKVQRKWQEEVRSAKTSTAKTASWTGVKSKVTRGVSKAMSYTTTSNLDFLGRVSDNKSDTSDNDEIQHPKSGETSEGATTHKTIPVDEMVLIYAPTPTMSLTPVQMREEFVNTMLRTKSKAVRDSIIATGLLPVAYGIDILATLVWPFGGLGEIDTVWAYSSIRGAKTARSVTKRLSSSTSSTANPTGEISEVDETKDKLTLTFTPSQRVSVLEKYLTAECHKVDPKMFPGYSSAPLESDVLEAIGWAPRQSGGENRNWEDEQWETSEVKDDLKVVMHKAAKEWRKWCTAYAKDPEKAMKK